MSDFLFGLGVGTVIFLSMQILTNNTWQDGAMGVYEKTIECIEFNGEWVCARKQSDK